MNSQKVSRRIIPDRIDSKKRKLHVEKLEEVPQTKKKPQGLLFKVGNGEIPGYQDFSAFKAAELITEIPLSMSERGRRKTGEELRAFAKGMNPKPLPGSELSLRDWMEKVAGDIEGIDERLTKQGRIAC